MFERSRPVELSRNILKVLEAAIQLQEQSHQAVVEKELRLMI